MAESISKMPQNSVCAFGFEAFGCEMPNWPVLLAVPHAGRDYPAELTANLRVDPSAIVKLEDRYADLLTKAARETGFSAIIASRPRAWMDLNRAENDLDPAMLRDVPAEFTSLNSPKQRGGLGLVPRRLTGVGEIWKARFPFADVTRRISEFHKPYHDAVDRVLRQMRAKFGAAILLDVHSMPPVKTAHGNSPDFVVGDRFGSSAASCHADLLRGRIEASGYRCALNSPYPGDYILRRHGRPERGIHAIQLEVDRRLYLDEAMREPGPGLAKISALVAELAGLLGDAIAGGGELLAAE